MSSARYETWADNLIGILSRCVECDVVIYASDEDIHDREAHNGAPSPSALRAEHGE